jgi:Tol biopolymer transport system component
MIKKPELLLKTFLIQGLLMINTFLMMSQNIFTQHSDIGSVKHAGSVVFDPNSETYTLSGSGKNMWFNDDEFFFLYKKTSGNFILNSMLEWVGKGVETHRKAGIIIRENLAPGSKYISISYHAGDGLISMQYRDSKDSATKEIKFDTQFLNVLQLEKDENEIVAKACKYGEVLKSIGKLNMSFPSDSFYLGLFVCSHNQDVIETCKFHNTRLYIPAKKGFIPYKDYIGSNLEIIDIETGLRKTIYQTPDGIEAPNWTKDGKFMFYNSKGLIFRISASGGNPVQINTDFANSNNNDHGLSPDGKQLVISHHAKEKKSGENSTIYILPIEGGKPKEITKNSPSYWHGWSVDGKWLIYTAKRDNNWNIHKISVNGGKETKLTDNEFLNDGSDFTPNGKYIWFNSNRTGTMQIWRMKADGTEQTQITFDNYQNWFAHPSPDGKKVVFLSYPPEVNSADHPYYKLVMLRIMDIDGNNQKVIAYLYGGQGTINVPSWLADSKKVAFVSNSN